MNRKERRAQAARPTASYEESFGRAVALMVAQRHAEAETELRAALAARRTLEAHHNLGAVLMELGRPNEAVASYRAALKLSADSQRTHNSLVKPLVDLGRLDEAAKHGTRALELKDREATVAFERYRSLLPPKPVPVRPPTKDLIAYSLWGTQPIYLDGALRNVERAAQLYPGWRVRVHLDDSVPAATVSALSDAGAEVVTMPRPVADRPYDGLFWRFLAADDADARHVLFRDCDSLLSARDAAAVHAWLDSGRLAHVMRDHVLHCDLILAGLWGVDAARLPRLGDAIAAWIAANPHPLNARVQDQTFLRHVVWPLIRGNHIGHDSIYRIFGAEDYPREGPPLGMRDVMPR